MDTGVGSKDASADVVVGKTISFDILDLANVDVTVTNNSEKTSDYYIELTLNSKDGSEQFDDSVVFVDKLKPGQTKKAQANFISASKDDLPKNVVVTLETVQRTAS